MILKKEVENAFEKEKRKRKRSKLKKLPHSVNNQLLFNSFINFSF